MKRLRRESGRTGKSMAQLIREAVDRVLIDDEYEQRAARLLALAGKFSSDVDDLAENHDEYFARAVEERLGLERRRAP